MQQPNLQGAVHVMMLYMMQSLEEIHYGFVKYILRHRAPLPTTTVICCFWLYMPHALHKRLSEMSLFVISLFSVE